MSAATMSEIPSHGAIAITTGGRALPLRAAWLRVDARGGLARVVLEQEFVNDHAEPLQITYQLPLPADGAVGGYRFRVGEREIVGEVDRKDRARERFEQAILDGHTAALLEQDRSSLFTQEIGNVPAGARLVVEVEIDQPLSWTDDGWEWRFPTVVAPRYLGAPGRVDDGARVVTHTSIDPTSPRMGLALTIRDAELTPSSPSHAIVVGAAAGSTTVGLGEGVALDRDVVVRWTVAQPAAGASLDLARPEGHGVEHGFGLLTLVPARHDARTTAVARDLVVLLDTSGSMSGEPIAQARRVIGALVDRLGDRDTLEMIEFSTAPRRWNPQAVPASADNRARARAWLEGLRPSGGTEMRAGIVAALATLRAEAQRQIVLVSDGLIGFESEIVAEILDRMPAGSRVHTVGVGSAVNRSLTLPAARAGHGGEIIVGVGEDPERAAARLVTLTDAPAIVDLELSGDALVDHAPQRLPDLLAGAPARISVRVRPDGGRLVVRGRTAIGTWEQRVNVPACSPGQGSRAVVGRFARERVEDLEMQRAAGREATAIDREIAELGLGYRIATRLTSWVAIDPSVAVDPLGPSRREVVPQALPHGMSASGLGLRAPQTAMLTRARSTTAGAPQMIARRMVSPAPSAPAAMAPPAPAPAKPKGFIESVVRSVAAIAGGGRRAEAEESTRSAPRPEQPKQADGLLHDQGGLELRAHGELELRATKRWLAEGVLVFEITAPPDGMVWELPAEVELELADGTRVVASVEATRSTRAGSYREGLSIRLVCIAAHDLDVAAVRAPGVCSWVIRT